MLQRLGIRGKILAVVAVPILVLLLAAGFITLQATNALADASNAQKLVAAADAARPLQAAMNTERAAGANFVDTFTSYSSDRAGAQTTISTTITALQKSDPAAYAKLAQILKGGQDTDSGAAMSVDEARALAPSLPSAKDDADDADDDAAPIDPTDASEWWTWPSATDAARAVDSLRAMSTAVDDASGSVSDDSAQSLHSIAFQLNLEATATSNLLTVPQVYQEAYLDSLADTVNTWQGLRSRLNAIPTSDANESVNEMAATIESEMDELTATRTSVLTIGNSAAKLSSWYATLLSGVDDFINRSTIAVNDPDLSIQLTAYRTMYNFFQQLSLESTLTERIIRQGQFKPGDATAARNQIAATEFALGQAKTATGALAAEITVPDWGASTTPTSNLNFLSIRNSVSTGDGNQLPVIATSDWVDMVDAEAGAQKPAYDQTIGLAKSRADTLHQQALLQTTLTAIAAIAAVVLSLLVALLISRRIVVPLRRLTTTATAVRAELPRLVERVAMPGESVDVAEVQIPVESQDEVGRLADAFNGVNAATLSIASEQAALRGSISEMFVNVARRDQVLLNRQLASIDDMERTQDDPDTLTKLFALDHLATRMRRNSESLLVLAGIDTGRRLRRAMPLSDVIRTASSEIELYERVQLELDADPAMLGHSALTAAHLFAELLENATVFSDPGTPVVVRTGERDDQYVVEIQDSGIGMTAEELEEANSRVASTAASEILGAQRLGLFVVGRIARRIGARVSIASTEGEGTTATILMTRSLFDASYAPDLDHHSEGTVDEAMHAPAALVSHNAENEQFDSPALPVDAYQPTVVEAAPLTAPAAEPSLDELIAADAAQAPAGAAVSGADLTDGLAPNGLPTRRRREGTVEATDEEKKNVIGLPARATAAQLSALEAATEDEGFTPAIPASEISPQTPEERAQMFRGFRSRRALGDAAAELDPEAESLGHAARRGGLAPEEIAAKNAGGPEAPALADDDFDSVADAPMVIPVLEADEDDAPLANAVDGDMLGGDAVVPAMEVPSLEDDDEAPSAAAFAEPVLAAEPALEAEPTWEAEPALAAEAEPAAEAAPVFEEQPSAPATAQPPAAAPFSYADVYGSLPGASQQPEPEPRVQWGVDSVSLDPAAAAPEPTLDELIAGSADEEAAKSSFFGRLFGRSKKDKPATASALSDVAQQGGERKLPPVTAPLAVPEAAPEPQAAPAFEAPVFDAPVETPPAFDAAPPAAEPTFDAAPAFDAAPPAAEPTFDAAPSFEAAPEPVAPGGAFALWTSQPAADHVPAPSVEERPALEVPVAGQSFSPDELANPFGWEAAGASALAAAEPEIATEYQPVVDIHPEEDGEVAGQAELTTAVFSELSSLAAERPKVETTRAGLQRRRAADAPAPEVKPIEAEVQIAPKERDADEVRSRFSSFYSGTQRARNDVAEFEQRSQSAVGKE